MTELPSSDHEASVEFRAAPGAHWPAILSFVGAGLLCSTGVVWLVVKPGRFTVGRILTAAFLSVVGALLLAGAIRYGRRLQRRFQLRATGLGCFDGRQSHFVAWDDVCEIYEAVNSVKLLSITVDAPRPQIVLVTTNSYRCELDQSISQIDQLAPLVAREVNRRLTARALHLLQQGRAATFGCLNLAQTGVCLTAPPALSWREALLQQFESRVNSRIVVPGDYPWQNVRDLRIARAIHGSRWAEHTEYPQLEICVHGRSSPVFICAVSEFPNFAVFSEVLNALGRSLSALE